MSRTPGLVSSNSREKGQFLEKKVEGREYYKMKMNMWLCVVTVNYIGIQLQKGIFRALYNPLPAAVSCINYKIHQMPYV